MYNSSAAYKLNIQKKANQYLANEILGASQEKMLLKIYDFAIANCKKKEILKTNNALNVLIEALRYDKPEAEEISMGLRRLYEFCKDQMRKHNDEIVLRILSELRTTWLEAFKVS